MAVSDLGRQAERQKVRERDGVRESEANKHLIFWERPGRDRTPMLTHLIKVMWKEVSSSLCSKLKWRTSWLRFHLEAWSLSFLLRKSEFHSCKEFCLHTPLPFSQAGRKARQYNNSIGEFCHLQDHFWHCHLQGPSFMTLMLCKQNTGRVWQKPMKSWRVVLTSFIRMS